jgi:hypothetical protein
MDIGFLRVDLADVLPAKARRIVKEKFQVNTWVPEKSVSFIKLGNFLESPTEHGQN